MLDFDRIRTAARLPYRQILRTREPCPQAADTKGGLA